MKKLTLLALFLSPLVAATAQVDQKLKEDIRNTGYVHSPLPLDYSKAFETWALNKTVLASEVLCDMESLDRWSHRGIGGMELSGERSKSGSNSLLLHAPTVVEEFLGWGLGRGTSMATFDVGGANWEEHNRLHFWIYPDCEGARSIYLNLYVENDGVQKVPDQYGREGYHEINLIGGQWNECFVEMTELARDKVTCIKFAIEVFGRERTMGEQLRFFVDDVQLQTIEGPEVVSGWQPAANRVIFSTTGYSPDSRKTAIVNVADHDGRFQIVDAATSRTVYEGDIKVEKTFTGRFETIDFTEFDRPGQYSIRVGEVTTLPFRIDANVWDDSAWRVANFMFVERCGYPVPGKHGTDHTDLHAEHNGKIYPMNGGWHDAADMSQQTLQTGEIAYNMIEAALNAKRKGNVDLHIRLMEEALWGMDYVLKSRLGDGYRAQTWGTNLWTDNILNTIDDAGRRQVRVHNRAFENFMFAGIEAYASLAVENDPMLVDHLKKVAKEDFGFAEARFNELGGYDELLSGGGGGDHAAMASQSQYMACVSWAASNLYKATGEQYYTDKAAEAIRLTLECQRTEPLGDKDGLRGFFYRDPTRRSIVHYNHQSRDQYYMMALTTLCETQPNHPDRTKWANAIALYGGYLKAIMKYVAPYGMVPSGVYNINEATADPAGFYIAQVGVRSGQEQNYVEQLKNGVKLDKEHYLKAFPVWFSFRGNAAVTLATGKNAALCGKFLNDPELRQIAEEQLMWIVGKNPFGQSLIWGEGSNYAQQYTALPGETVGEIPVGMQSRFNEDTPYWPQFNTATYKEVWGSSAGKWFTLIAEF
ncbi:MAG: glycoside hydrolase family 9 protein [Alistipes sp.]|jgi:hypothetical protein|nr:glycoside hydrolase family 9 protein [Alistipes sp.]